MAALHRFHNRTGALVSLSNDNRTAQRNNPTEEFNNGVVLSSVPLTDDQVLEVKIDKKVNSWSGSIEIGVTTCDPDNLDLPITATDFQEGTLVMSGGSVHKDGHIIIEEYGCDLDQLSEGDVVGVMRSSTGELHFFVNGVDQGTAATDIPANVYAVTDMYGRCTQVSIIESTDNRVTDTRDGAIVNSDGLIPAEILRMDKNSIEIYKRALSEGKESVHNIRVMIVGHYGVGKTTLTKRLFGEDVDISKRESTDGIDVHVRRCKVSLDTGKWNILNKEQKPKMACHRLIKLFKTPNIDNNTPEKEEIIMDASDDDGDGAVGGSISSIDERATNKEQAPGCDPNDFSVDKTGNITEFTTVNSEGPGEGNISNHLKELIEEIQQHPMDDGDSDAADLSVWDFAGQFAFYATHQTFLSRRAVYLLVTDISKHVQDIVEDNSCFIDSKGKTKWKIYEFVDFWLNSIHEFCNSPGEEGPPVIQVGTFADKLKPETKAKTVNKFFCNLRKSLVDKVTFCHLVDEDFAMGNSKADNNVEKLKKKILDVVSKQKYWGESVPAKWITLENIFDTLRDESLKVLFKDQLRDLNSKLPVPLETEEELELFLRFHHDCGNILYFSEEKLHDSIILDPQWLIDAFKSLITAEEFCCTKSQNVLKKWVDFDQSAILTKELIDVIWDEEKNGVFREYKELLLDYLEKLRFIAKPLLQDAEETADDYFAPCVLKMPPPEGLLENNDCATRKSSSKLGFKTSSRFLPTAAFNKLLAVCISKWPLSTREGKPAIFCGCGIFDLNENHSAYICFFNHEIQIWLTRLSTTGQEPDRELCSEVKVFISDLLRNRIMTSSRIEEYVRCPTATFHSSDNAFAMEELVNKTEVVCRCREEHVLLSKDLTKYWQMEFLPSSFADSSCKLTEKNLGRIAKSIGHGWKLLGIELGLTKPQMEQISEDNKQSTETTIHYMLLQWDRQNSDKATVGCLYIAMKNCSSVTFDWKAIERVFSEVERNE